MRAFELRSQYTGDGENAFAGGQIAIGPLGHTLDVGARLRNSDDGVIVTADPSEGDALANYPALKEITGERLAVIVNAKTPRPIDEQSSKADMVAKADELGIPSTGTKDELLARIREAVGGGD